MTQFSSKQKRQYFSKYFVIKKISIPLLIFFYILINIFFLKNEVRVNHFSLFDFEKNLAEDRNWKYCDETNDVFIEGKGGRDVLKKVRQGVRKSKQFLEERKRQGLKDNRVMCLVYTVALPNNKDNLKSIAETWGKQCDGFLAASNETDPSVGSIDIVHKGKEEYANMWQKVRSMWNFTYRNYINDFDFFLIAGDDTYVAVENLKAYLNSFEVERLEDGYIDLIQGYFLQNKQNGSHQLRPRPLVLGAPFMSGKLPLISGGPGYVLNRQALKLFGTKGAQTYKTDVVDPTEDFHMALFFISYDIYISDTLDKDGGRRFGGSAQNSFEYKGVGPSRPRQAERQLGLQNKKGIAGVSEQQITFHLKDDLKHLKNMGLKISDSMKRYHYYLHDFC